MEQILPLQIRLDVGIRAMKGYTTFPQIQNQMLFNAIPRTSNVVNLVLQQGAQVIFCIYIYIYIYIHRMHEGYC